MHTQTLNTQPSKKRGNLNSLVMWTSLFPESLAWRFSEISFVDRLLQRESKIPPWPRPTLGTRSLSVQKLVHTVLELERTSRQAHACSPQGQCRGPGQSSPISRGRERQHGTCWGLLCLVPAGAEFGVEQVSEMSGPGSALGPLQICGSWISPGVWGIRYPQPSRWVFGYHQGSCLETQPRFHSFRKIQTYIQGSQPKHQKPGVRGLLGTFRTGLSEQLATEQQKRKQEPISRWPHSTLGGHSPFPDSLFWVDKGAALWWGRHHLTQGRRRGEKAETEPHRPLHLFHSSDPQPRLRSADGPWGLPPPHPTGPGIPLVILHFSWLSGCFHFRLRMQSIWRGLGK